MPKTRTSSAAPPEGAPSPRRTQAERVAESDRRMFEAAMRLIASRGYTPTTLEAIGTEAGYSRGLVQHRFGSKDKLLEALINKIADDHRERLLVRLRGLSGLQALECEIDAYLEGMDDPPVNSRAFFVLMLESIGPAPQIRHAFDEISTRWHQALAGQIAKGQQQGRIRAGLNPQMEAQLLIATVRGLRTQSMLSPHTRNIASAIAALKAQLRERFAPLPAPAASAPAPTTARPRAAPRKPTR
ncbi:MAG: TetR/AcrR family transcriptional regulator [Burkholderiales bacterium]|nr:TetR/AcrR family transcriptional regulator [Burkholderiales bacterium]